MREIIPVHFELTHAVYAANQFIAIQKLLLFAKMTNRVAIM